MKQKHRKLTKREYVRSIYRRNGGVAAFISSSVAVIAGIEHDINVTGSIIAVIVCTGITIAITGAFGVDEFDDKYKEYVEDYEERNNQ